MKYENIDVNAITIDLKSNGTKVDELRKYLDNEILFDLSNNTWESTSKDKMVTQIKKIQGELADFNKLIDSVVIDLNSIERIKKYDNEINILEQENEALSSDDYMNQAKINDNNSIIESYKDIIKSNEIILEKWR